MAWTPHDTNSPPAEPDPTQPQPSTTTAPGALYASQLGSPPKLSPSQGSDVGTPTTQLSFVCPAPSLTAQQCSLSYFSLSVTPVSAPSSEPSTTSHHGTSTGSNLSTSHTYQLHQLANGKVGWTASDQNKRRPFWPTKRHSEGSNCRQHIKKKKERTSDCPATMPRGPGTPPFSRACSKRLSVPHLQQPRADWLTTQPTISQLHPASTTRWSCHLPGLYTVQRTAHSRLAITMNGTHEARPSQHILRTIESQLTQLLTV
jgi:hypothetical protein